LKRRKFVTCIVDPCRTIQQAPHEAHPTLPHFPSVRILLSLQEVSSKEVFSADIKQCREYQSESCCTAKVALKYVT